MKQNEYSTAFFKLLDKKPDSAQINAITTTKNAVIAAGAGSGKTQVLAQRFSWLVLTGQAKADQILTLTFTNKAASEMYQRIYATLNFFDTSPVSENFTENEKKLAQQGIVDFTNAHIQTLDSYCSNIVRQCANRYGITPDFSLASSDGVAQIKQEALKFVFRNSDRLSIQTFVKPGDFQKFAEQVLASSIIRFTDLTTPKGFFCSKLPVQLNQLIIAFQYYFDEQPLSEENLPGKNNFQKLIDEFYEQMEANSDPKKHAEYQKKASEIFDFYTQNFQGLTITNEKINNSDYIKNLQTLFEVFSQNINELSAMKGKCTKANTKITIIKNELLPVIDSIFAYFSQLPAITSLYELFDDFLAEVNASKRASGNLTFNDVSALALKILIENKDIRTQEIQAYKKIMIDEFQDNNSKNRDLLYLLSVNEEFQINQNEDIYRQIIQKNQTGEIIKDNREPEKLFFVGDEKQSIYKFRGADVSVFNELTKNDENLLVPMTFNYRSTAQTVQAFNLIFKNSFGIFEDNSMPQDYEAYYTKDAQKNGMELPQLTKENVPIHFKFIDTKKIADENKVNKTPLEKFIHPDEQLAYNMAKQIYHLANSSISSDSSASSDSENLEKQNKINWGDFAILDRSRTHRGIITKYLSYFNIPYEVDQFTNIFEDGIINDFYNFLRICVYPSDVNAFCAYLASPLCGLHENSIEIILSYLIDSTDYDFVFDPTADFDSEIQKDLPQNEFLKFIEAKDFYIQNKSLVLQQKITKTLDMLWNQTGYKYETYLNKQTELCAEQFDMIFELARRSEENDKTVSWFIDELDLLKSTFSSDDADINTKDITYPLERSGAVKIMTIHKSKGLQFKHVFLWGCTSYSFSSEKSQIFFDKYTGLSVRPESGVKNFFVMQQEILAKKMELAEFRRLIYVGITRAIDDIYVMGKWNPQAKEPKEEINQKAKIFENPVNSNYGDSLENDVSYKESLPFDFENINPVTFQDISSKNENETTEEQRHKIIEKSSSYFENAEIIEYTCKPVLRISPSKIGEMDKLKKNIEKIQNVQNLSQSQNYKQIQNQNDQDEMDEDELLFYQNENEEEKLQKSVFNQADFGVLVHAYLEAFVKDLNPQTFEPPVSLFKNLTENEIQTKKGECIQFVKNFAESEIGIKLQNAKNKNRFVRSEWKTKMFDNGAIYTGLFDLIFQNEDKTYTIVDYKYSENLNPQKYYSQLNCYRKTASMIFEIPESQIDCKIWDIKKGVIFQVPADHQ